MAPSRKSSTKETKTPEKKGSANRRPKTKSLGLEVGDTGTEILHGIINEEYNVKLRDIQGIKIYDEMRKSDGTVAAALLAITLPIRRASWYIQAGDETPESEKIREFIDKAMFEWQTITWNSLLRQALLMLPFGVMPFEKVFEIRTFEGRDYVTWRKLAPRLPKSIERWELDDGTTGIIQRTQEGIQAQIPMDKLVVFVNDMEGENWWGTSVLRAAYKHWYIKNTFYRIDAIAFERQGLGVPYAKLPENATEKDRETAREILQNLRAHHQAYIIEPQDYEVGFKDMMAKSLRDPEKSIAHHNREIVKSVLAQFLELGATDSGSRALSKDQTELFLQSLSATAANIADVFNKYAIEQLVDLNFDNVENYPKLVFTGIDRVDAEKLSNAYNTLVTAGGIKADLQTDEPFLRALLGLPEREYVEGDDEDVAAKKAEKEKKEDPEGKKKEDPEDEDNEDDDLEEAGMSAFGPTIKKKIYPERDEVAIAIKASTVGSTPAEAVTRLKQRIAYLSERPHGGKHDQFFGMVKGELTKELVNQRKYVFAESNDYEAPLKEFRRPLTLSEKKVNYKALEAEMDRLEAEMQANTQELLNKAREDYMKELTTAVNRDDVDAIKAATIKVNKAYARIIKKSMRDAYEYGKNNAAVEEGVRSPASSESILKQIDIQSTAIAEAHIAEITNDAKTRLTDHLNRGDSKVAALAAADALIAKQILKLTKNTSQIAMAGYINFGRDTVAETIHKDIYAKQRSEILDKRTCNYCLSLDGRVVDKDDPFVKNKIFHTGCRGIWVNILLTEENLPKIGGIPKGLRDRFGDEVNDLVQPSKPQPKSKLAKKQAEKRDE